MTLAELVRDVAEKRHAMKALKGEYDGAFAEFNDAHRDLLNTIAATNEDLSESEKKLRSAVLAAPEEEIKATFGVGTRKKTTIRYDEREAICWAIDHGHPNLLSLNAREFHQVATALKLDFVEIEEGRQATISRDLSGAL